MSTRIRLAPAMLAWLLLGACPTTDAQHSPPNILVLVFEGLRGDRFDRILNADDALALPALQRLARYGVVFPDSLADDLDGIRALRSLCSGRASFGPRSSQAALDDSTSWLPTVLCTKGWPELLGTTSRRAMTRAERMTWIEARRAPSFADQVDDVLARVHENPPEPWSLWLTSQELRWPFDAGNVELSAEHFRRREELGLVSDDQRKELRQSYDEELRALDHQLARLCEALDRNGQFERTVFVVLSTGGTGLGEGARYGPIGEQDQLLRAPWLIRMPGDRVRRIEATRTQPSDMPAILLEALAPSISHAYDESTFARVAKSVDSVERLRVCRASTRYLLDEGESWRLHIRYRGSQIVLDDLSRPEPSASPAPALDSPEGQAIARRILLRYQAARYRRSLHDRHAEDISE